jgi:hypothetical protein
MRINEYTPVSSEQWFRKKTSFIGKSSKNVVTEIENFEKNIYLLMLSLANWPRTKMTHYFWTVHPSQTIGVKIRKKY